MLKWNLYEIITKESPVTGVMVRGRVRKFCLQNEIDLLIENASDKDNCVRFGLLNHQCLERVQGFIESIISDAEIFLIQKDVINPVLSKLKVNKEERYSL